MAPGFLALLRPALEEIIDLGRALARWAREIDWESLDRRSAGVCRPCAGQPGLPTRLVAGPLIPEAHARFVGRGAVRALAGKPVLPVLLWRTQLLPQAAARPLVHDRGGGAINGSALSIWGVVESGAAEPELLGPPHHPPRVERRSGSQWQSACRRLAARPASAWRTGSCGAPWLCRISCARRRGCRGSGSRRA